ncbi:tryptophan--tRNA ligase [Methanococcus voltae]|uniref:Tryptophan--tRNA ligase n=2 Tax=Methanococcus voltae TaxID=2188 RepID=A0A8J7RFX1_METVO|nr:tryptophan--tRNA ligase [Methanococcus voltae]MBP2172229.1 tryptophanyl-tRNA synthetase [Methanococcus voltae]MBP2200815.1 tryptophanyl-tRNA synthetase [Methanococcus voltae]MCS3921539.1 tryptophanyl-tRNA synthetase [Methanococcus voltae PS]
MITPWEVTDDVNYKNIMENFGIKGIEEAVAKLEEPHQFMNRGIIFGHRDFDKIADTINEEKKFAVVSGMMPSGKMHMGHKMVVDQLIYYQNLGAEIYIPIADLEAYWARDLSFETTKKLAIEEYIANYIALGLNPEKINVYLQSKNEGVKDLALRLAKRVNFTEMKSIYGFKNETNIGHIYAPLVQVADILHPQMVENEKLGITGNKSKVPVLVPVGIDQDPHIRLTRDIANRYKDFKFIPPASTYHRFMTGLLGGKMSSSKPETAIYLTDETTKSFKKKVMSCKTGGRETLEEQKEKGGMPEECVIYEICAYHFMNDKELKELYEDCKSGKLTCGTCKKQCYEKVSEFLTDLKEKRDNAMEVAQKILE